MPDISVVSQVPAYYTIAVYIIIFLYTPRLYSNMSRVVETESPSIMKLASVKDHFLFFGSRS